MIPSLGGLGRRFIIAGSYGSTPRAKAGRAAVTRFIHSICMGDRRNGMYSMIAVKTAIASGKPGGGGGETKLFGFFFLFFLSPPPFALGGVWGGKCGGERRGGNRKTKKIWGTPPPPLALPRLL